MRHFFTLFLLFCLGICFGQNSRKDFIDSVYVKLEQESYSIRKVDSIEFSNGSNSYRFIIEHNFRPDTVMVFKDRRIKFGAMSFEQIKEYPRYKRKMVWLGEMIIDTIRSPDDPSHYFIEKYDSINIRYAQSLYLNKDSLRSSINEIKNCLTKNGIDVVEIVLSFYPRNGQNITLNAVSDDDFDGVQIVKASYLISINNIMTTYPVIFEIETVASNK